MSPVAITLLMLVGLTGFALLAWRKLRLVGALRPDARWDEPRERLRTVLVNGLLQRRMIRREWRAGLMHAAIFAGFASLLLRKLQLIAIGYDELAAFPSVLGPFAALKDSVELVVIIAVLYAFYRRLVAKPPRLEPNREALLVLALILSIMLTDIAFDAFRFQWLGDRSAAIAAERDHAYLGRALAAALGGLTPAALQVGYGVSYWLQMIVVFSFLVLLPAGEHFHIVTALPTLYLRRGHPANRVPAVDIDALMVAEDETQMQAGVRSAADLTWKEGLDVFTCTECGRCKDACPTQQSGKPLSQKGVNDSLKRHLLEQRRALVAGDTAGLPPLVPGVISAETLWSCTTCGYCEAACPIELEHLDRFFRLRQHQVLIEGNFPHELKKAFEAWEVQSNPWGLPAEQRGDWACGLGVPVATSADQVAASDFVFYVGSAMSFDPRGQKIARAFVEVLRHAGVSVVILGPREGSTGECARRLGNELLFQTLAKALIDTLTELGVTRIVTCDPHAYNTLRNEYPAFGGRYEVLHHTQLIARLLRDGRLRPRRGLERVLFHDPCYLGRHNGEFDAPREVLGALCSDRPLEFALSRQKSMCCGAGGGQMWIEETVGRRINVVRAEQALAQRPAMVATGCPYCAVMMGDGLAELGDGSAIPSKDIAELMAEALHEAADPAVGAAQPVVPRLQASTR